MKKFLAVLAVLALVCISSMAFAADITVSGQMDVRSRDFKELSMDKDVASPNDVVDTQMRVRLNVNAKSDNDNVKAKISIENDWDTWGRFEEPMADANATSVANKANSGFLDLREAWVSFNLPGIPVNVTAGHQLLQTANGWFFRSMKYGSDAWVVANVTGANTAALVDVKIAEGIGQTSTGVDLAAASSQSDDVDAYVLLDVFKINENMTVGAFLTAINDRKNLLQIGSPNPAFPPFPVGSVPTTKETQLQNLSLIFNGKLGPVNLQADLGVQAGKAKGELEDRDFKGWELVAQGNIALDPITINATLAGGSGDKAGDKDIKRYVNFLDTDQHYTLLYEYKIGNPTCGTHAGFCNTTAINGGVMFAATKSLSIGADLWWLMATEKVPDLKSGTGDTNELGLEADVKVNWQLYDSLSWNWTLAYLDPGKGLSAAGDAAYGAQGVLSYKF